MRSVVIVGDKILKYVKIVIRLLVRKISIHHSFQSTYDTFSVIRLSLIVGDIMSHVFPLQETSHPSVEEFCTYLDKNSNDMS